MKIIKADPIHRQQFHDVQLGLIDRLLIKNERERPDFNRRMFDEDFARLFRSTNRRRGNLFEIVSNDDELTQRLLSNVKTRYAPHPVDETVRELVEEIAQSLIWFGTAYYFLQDDRECPAFCVSVIWSMLPERSKDDDDFERVAGRTAEGLQAA